MQYSKSINITGLLKKNKSLQSSLAFQKAWHIQKQKIKPQWQIPKDKSFHVFSSQVSDLHL